VDREFRAHSLLWMVLELVSGALEFSVCDQLRAAFELSWCGLICGDFLF